MTFTTKKTRAISALAAIMMLLSLMTCFVLPVSAEEETYTIYRELWMDGRKVMDLPAIEEVAVGVDFTAAELELQGYALTDDSQFQAMGGLYYMPARNIVLTYTNTVVDFDPLDAALMALSRYDMAVFTEDPAAAIEDFLAEMEELGVSDGMAESALGGTSYTETLAALNGEVADLVDAAALSGLKLKNVVPYLPGYADKDLYSGFSLAVGSALAGYAIADAADWFAVLKDAQKKNVDFAGTTLVLTNDVDLAGFADLDKDLKEILPVFAGTLDGRGYSFKNVVINEAAQNAPVGLIGTLAATGVVKNLGIASGSVVSAYKAPYNSLGIAAVVGKAMAGAKVVKVWNAADVKVTGAYEESEGVAKKDYPVAGIVGIAEAGAKINGCYNLGEIVGGDKVAELANGAADVTNGFAAGLNPLAEAATMANLAYLDSSDPYAFAYKMNAGYVAADEYVAFTVENGAVVLVYDENDKAVVKVTVDTVPDKATDFEFDYSFFAMAGDTVLLDASYVTGTYEIKEGSGTIIEKDGKFYLELGQSDVKVSVAISPLDSTALIAALAYYKNKNAAAFENSAELTAALARARKNNYKNDAEMAADVAILNANQGLYTTTHPETLPAVSEMANYPDAAGFGYTIHTVDELMQVAANPADSYGKLYLAADLDLTGETFDGLKDLNVAFDGLGHVITGWLDADGGFFDGFIGGSIANLTISGAKLESGAVLMNETAVAVTLDGVHVKDALIQKANADDLGFLIGKATAKVIILNSSVMNSQMLNDGGYVKNHGVLLGSGTEVVIKNVVAAGNTIKNVELGSGAGLLVATATDVAAENVAITFNNINVKAAAAEGMALISTDADGAAESIYAEGNQVLYDGLGQGGAISFLNAGGTVRATVYRDEAAALAALNGAVSDTNGYLAWTLDATYETLTLVMGSKADTYTVTFKVGALTVATYLTDEFGHLYKYKNTDLISKYSWPEVSALATHVFTADTVLTADATIDHMDLEVVGAVTEDTVANVQALLKKNPGLRAVTFKVTFDKANFELVNVANGDLFGDLVSYDPSSDPNATGTFEVTVWDNEVVTANGVALKMTFAPKGEEGVYTNAVTIEVVSAYDNYHNPVAFDAETVDITVEQGVVWGDADNDGVVTSADVSMLLQYIVGKIPAVTNPAAVELDGVSGLTVVDAQIIFRALANNTADSIKPIA